MNILTDELKDYIIVNDRKIIIYTDFRYYVEIYNSLLKTHKDETELFMYCLDIVKDDGDKAFICFSEENMIAFINEVVNFISNNSQASNKPHKATRNRYVLSFEDDANYIVSGFYECYKIDLTEEYLHWHKFNALLDGLNEKTELKQRMMYRSIDASKIKDKTERKRIKDIQRKIAIKVDDLTDEEIANAF